MEAYSTELGDRGLLFQACMFTLCKEIDLSAGAHDYQWNIIIDIANGKLPFYSIFVYKIEYMYIHF